MKFDITEGTYVNKKDKDFVEYLVKCGKVGKSYSSLRSN